MSEVNQWHNECKICGGRYVASQKKSHENTKKHQLASAQQIVPNKKSVKSILKKSDNKEPLKDNKKSDYDIDQKYLSDVAYNLNVALDKLEKYFKLKGYINKDEKDDDEDGEDDENSDVSEWSDDEEEEEEKEPVKEVKQKKQVENKNLKEFLNKTNV